LIRKILFIFEIFFIGKEKCIFGEEAFKRIRLGVVLQMTSIGIPMIWMGEEIGE
jgi:1,4-alpha-glucan branching enzyme